MKLTKNIWTNQKILLITQKEVEQKIKEIIIIIIQKV